MTTSPSSDVAKIGVKSVWVERAEGPTDDLGEVTFEGSGALQKAQDALRKWGRTAPKSGKGYDKCDFVVTFEDGDTYSGRYDLENTGLNDSGETVAEQMRSFLGFQAGTRRPAWCSDQEWAQIVADKEADGTARAAKYFLEKYDF